MKLKLHSPVLGKQPGEQVDVDSAYGEWLVQQGYAAKSGADEDTGLLATSVAAKSDPTLAENREAPGEEPRTQRPTQRKKSVEQEPEPAPTEE